MEFKCACIMCCIDLFCVFCFVFYCLKGRSTIFFFPSIALIDLSTECERDVNTCEADTHGILELMKIPLGLFWFLC